VPQHENEWFRQNSMSVYNVDLTLDSDNLLNDLSNLVLLRSDVHAGFDERKFVFYPKGQTSFVVHILEPSPDLAQLYHNVEVQMPFNCHPNFLYAHLAWAIFPSLAGFWSKPGVKRAVLTCKETEDGRELVEQEVMITPEFQAKIISSRSRSPKKRQRPQDESTEVFVPDSKRARLRASMEQTEPSAAPQTSHYWHRCNEENDDNGTHSASAAVVQTFPRAESSDDQRILHRFSPQALQLCPTWYAGYKEVDNMRNNWLSKERRKNQISVT